MPTLYSTQNWTTNLHCRDAIVDGVAFEGFEAGALDHFDDLLFGHFYFAFAGVAEGEFAAFGSAVQVV
jgi:hypothetical protein